jgi:DNA-directed RNA polymerase subunit beta'
MRLKFQNEVINKKKLQSLMHSTFHNYGVIKSSLIADKVKNLTFHYATISGISLSVEDLRVPYVKRALIGMTTNEVDLTEQNFKSGNITTVERFQKVIDIWNNANNSLKDDVLTYFRESDPLNPLYIMAFSGARGNISQVRQLVGMRGLMADPQGQIIDLPIKSNFREGLKVTEYIISSYGARKGLVDTALRTADSGYLTRRLVDVAQDIIVREEDCLTKNGLSFDDLFKKYPTNSSFKDRLIGRLLVEPIRKTDGELLFSVDTEIDNNVIAQITDLNLKDIKVRSPLTCDATRSVCRKCYGWHLSYSKIIDLGEAVGILAAQSIGEPGTQLTMRTFHTGGVFSGDLTKQIRAPFKGTVKYDFSNPTKIIRTIHGEKGFNLTKNLTLVIEDNKQSSCSLALSGDATLFVNNGEQVYRNQIIAEIKKDANLVLEEERKNIYTEVSGEIFLQNIKVQESIDGDGALKKISKTKGLIWVLYGKRYVLQNSARLNINLGQRFFPNERISNQEIITNYSGIVNFDNVALNNEIKIINSSMILENAIIVENKNRKKFDRLELFTKGIKNIFQLNIKRKENLKHGQTVAVLLDDSYKTKTGGIVYYSIIQPTNKKRRQTKQLFTGSLYWIPEETHQLTSTSIENVKIKDVVF